MTLLTFATQSKASLRSLGYSGERLVNLFLRKSEGVSKYPLVGRSGTVEFADVGAPVRNMVSMGGALYAVAGDTVFKVVSGSVTDVGKVSRIGIVYMSSSANEVAIVVDRKYYVCDGAATTQYSTGAITEPHGVTYQDGYFIVSGNIGTRRDGITVSGLDDGTTFNPLRFAFAENSPDGIQAIISVNGQLWALGWDTVELFYNSGAQDFPFQVNKGALIEQGCTRGRTVAKDDNSVFWVRPDGAVVRAAGVTPQVISTPEIQEMVNDGTLRNGFTFADRGQKFYCITFLDRTSLAYDLSTGLWAERSTGVGDMPWFCRVQATLNRVEYFGTTTGKIVTFDPDVFTDVGDVIEAVAVSVPVERNGEQFSINKVHLNIRSGGVDIGRTPRVMLQSTDNGHVWSVEKWRNLGRKGEYYKRTSWGSFGSFRRAQFKLTITDAVPRDIYGVAYA